MSGWIKCDEVKASFKRKRNESYLIFHLNEDNFHWNHENPFAHHKIQTVNAIGAQLNFAMWWNVNLLICFINISILDTYILFLYFFFSSFYPLYIFYYRFAPVYMVKREVRASFASSPLATSNTHPYSM